MSDRPTPAASDAPATRDESENGPGPPARTKVLAGAGSFTGLWALTWLGSSALSVGAAAQGAFAVGGVMASSGLTVLWWKTRAIRALHPEAAASEQDEMGAEKAPAS